MRLKACRDKVKLIDKDLKSKRKDGILPFFDLPYSGYWQYSQRQQKEIKTGFENFVLIGIGGSSLGPKALHKALNPPYYNELPKREKKRLSKDIFS